MQLSNQLMHLFPLLKNATNNRGEHITQFAKQIVLSADTTIFHQGEQCQNYMLVISGSIKVFTRSENGKAIVLYHITNGHSCVLTTSCLLSTDTYPAEGITETDVVALAIPAAIFNEFVDQSAGFRQLVFNTYGNKISRLIALVNKISFSRLDLRIAHFLLENSSINTPLITTHQSLANELGSAREVISRQLKEFENKGWVKLSRGKIEIINHDALHNLQAEA
ncbi:MAG: Crp/Fnr family transcriptional regulator [Pseudomonadota bacterium]